MVIVPFFARIEKMQKSPNYIGIEAEKEALNILFCAGSMLDVLLTRGQPHK